MLRSMKTEQQLEFLALLLLRKWFVPGDSKKTNLRPLTKVNITFVAHVHSGLNLNMMLRSGWWMR